MLQMRLFASGATRGSGGETLGDARKMQDEEMLRCRGQRLTSQRRTVLEIMQRSHGHVTAENVAHEARADRAAVSLASVYRILEWLTEHELVSVTDTGGSDLVYEYLGAGRHHHLICQRCGTETEAPYELILPMAQEIRARYGFEPRIDHQAIFGVCRRCQNIGSAKE